VKSYLLRMFIVCLATGVQAISAQAAMVSILGGNLTINYDSNVFADPNSSNYGLSAGQDFMRYGRFWSAPETIKGLANTAKAPQEFRPIAISNPGPGPNPKQPNFRDQRSTLNTLYPKTSPTEQLAINTTGVIPNSAGRNRLPTTLSYDPSNVTGTVNGLLQTNGVSAWWFAHDDIMNSGGAWVSWGDLSLRYDPSRVSLGYSGWVFANQVGGIGDIFDTKILSMSASSSGLQLSGELWSSDGTSSDPYNENYATWESYTLMNPNLKIGTFSFSGITAVPEPSTIGIVAVGVSMGLWFCKRKRKSISHSN
jgi:hypothetical protein